MEAGRKLELFVYKGRGSVDLQHLTLSCILTTSRFTHSLIFFKSPFFWTSVVRAFMSSYL